MVWLLRRLECLPDFIRMVAVRSSVQQYFQQMERLQYLPPHIHQNIAVEPGVLGEIGGNPRRRPGGA